MSNFDYISDQFCLAKDWLISIRKCKCELDETTDDCKHIRKALNKLYGKQINDLGNELLKERVKATSEIYGFKIPYKLQESLSS